jgi:hypothetical protein
MDIIIPEFYIFIAGIIILILMIGICLYYFWVRRTSITNIQQVPLTNNRASIDDKNSRPAWLHIMIGDKYCFLYEDERGFYITPDPNKITKFRYHNRDSTLLKDLNIQLPMLNKQTVALESMDSILEIRYLESSKVQAILRYQKHTGYITRYFHVINGKLVLDNNSNDQVVFELRGLQ